MNLVARAEGLVSDAVEKHALGERIDFAVIPGLAPTGPNQVQPILAVSLTLPSGNIGEFLEGHDVITTIAPDESIVETLVAKMVEGLKQARTQALSQLNGHGHSHAEAPSGPPGFPPGLLGPGG